LNLCCELAAQIQSIIKMVEASISQKTEPLSLSIIGGTGMQGRALAWRFAKAGVPVIIGSRDEARGAEAAEALKERLNVTNITGTSNREAARQGDIVLLSVPYEGMQPILQDIYDAVENKIVINIASSLDPEKRTRAKLPPGGSITAEIQSFFGDRARVVAAFQNISPEKLESPDARVDSDVLVCGGNRDARDKVIAMCDMAGIDAFDVGMLPNAVAVETLTAVLIAANVRYKVVGAGVRLTSVPRKENG
jgi:NADPH-dependent F420 reductase